MKLQEEIIRGEEAYRLINHELFKGAFKEVKESIINSMNDSAFGDEKTHNRLVIALQMLSQIEKNLKTHIQTGKMAELQASGNAFQKIQGIA